MFTEVCHHLCQVNTQFAIQELNMGITALLK